MLHCRCAPNCAHSALPASEFLISFHAFLFRQHNYPALISRAHRHTHRHPHERGRVPRVSGALFASPPFRRRNSIVQVQRLRLRRNCFDFEAFFCPRRGITGSPLKCTMKRGIIVSHLHRRSLCAPARVFAEHFSLWLWLASGVAARQPKKRRQMNFIAFFIISVYLSPSRRRLPFFRSIQQTHSRRRAARRRFCDCRECKFLRPRGGRGARERMLTRRRIFFARNMN